MMRALRFFQRLTNEPRHVTTAQQASASFLMFGWGMWLLVFGEAALPRSLSYMSWALPPIAWGSLTATLGGVRCAVALWGTQPWRARCAFTTGMVWTFITACYVLHNFEHPAWLVYLWLSGESFYSYLVTSQELQTKSYWQ